ncbi:EG45-like domain containing protein [Quillaja saponaria]|uniref:EG45-like domain containing protein n=1 Tax=Quillaja saponaria TaxID=32244 RepID=A0AAD7QCN5_QUISA|nr:EG45-like domain containing protein [Quillaja saponaria]
MPRAQLHLLPWLSFFFTVSHIIRSSYGDVGTSAQYPPPYLPTACYGGDAGQFPSSNLFAAAGDGIWDNGAACGRQYLVRCISAEQPRTCFLDQNIQVKIVDYVAMANSQPSETGTTMVLSEAAFSTIANSSATLINIEFQQV